MTLDLFNTERTQTLADGLVLLRQFTSAQELFSAVQAITAAAPLRHLITPGGHTMSVAMTNCGHLGWVSDRKGYRYSPTDPDSGKPWPTMPEKLATLATSAATEAGFESFKPDVCLINSYEPGTHLSLHQDHDEGDFSQPIVSVSLGVSAEFMIGNTTRRKAEHKIRLHDGDIIVFGGPSRLIYHGIKPVEADTHPITGTRRINLTFRKAG